MSALSPTERTWSTSTLKLLHPEILAPQLARDALVADQVAGADGDEIAFGGLQKVLDLCRHGGVAVVDHLGHQRLELRILADAADDQLLYRGGVARLPSTRQQIEEVGRFLHIDQAAQQQTVLQLLGVRAATRRPPGRRSACSIAALP